MTLDFHFGIHINVSALDNPTFIFFFIASVTSYKTTTSVHLKKFCTISIMPTSIGGIFLTLTLHCTQIFHTFANEPDLEQLIVNSESAHWPLQAGYPGLTLENLNEYVSLFSHCLLNIQNYQGIEIIGISYPVRIARFDVAYFDHCELPSLRKAIYRFFFGKIPQKSKQNCAAEYDENLKNNYSDKSFTSRWYCTAHFDLFFPEPVEAPHIVYHSQQHNFYFKRDLFDVAVKYTDVEARVHYRDNWSKIL